MENWIPEKPENVASNRPEDATTRWGAKTFTQDKRDAYLDAIRGGISKNKAAQNIGVSRNVIFQYCRQNPSFQEEVLQAEFDATDLVEDVLMEKILLDRHYPAMVFWLVNRSNGRWKDIRQITMTTPEEMKDQKSVVMDILSRLDKEKEKEDKNG